MTDPTTVEPSEAGGLGQPRGLGFLVVTQFWVGFSSYGMQALLLLYMVEQLLQPGHVEAVAAFAASRSVLESVTGPLTTQALAAQIFGVAIGLSNFTPTFGGLLGDRLLGRRRGVVLGALLMTCGHFAMASERFFLLSLVLFIVGMGCLGGNIAPQVGALYGARDRRRADGFQIFFFMQNVGCFIGPLVTGALAAIYGRRVAFCFAGVGMLTGLVVYLVAWRHLPPDAPRAKNTGREPLRPDERRVVIVLLALLPIATLFWIGQAQVWNVYNLWVRDHVDLSIGGWSMPVPWLQAVDALAPAVLVPVAVVLWRSQAARGVEPDDIGKITIGCLLFAAAMAWLAAAQLVAGAGGRVPLVWAIAFHFLSNAGWLYFVPILTSLYARVAPPSMSGMMVGIFSLSTFAGTALSGAIGGSYERLSQGTFWLLHAAIVGIGGVLFLLFGPRLRSVLLQDA